MKTIATGLLVMLALIAAGRATAGPVPATAQARLLAVARLWGAIAYFDPAVAGNAAMNWDGALIDNLPAIDAAGTSAEYAAAVQRMLDTLHDPATRVFGPPSQTAAGPSFAVRFDDGVDTLSLGDLSIGTVDASKNPATIASFVKNAATATGIVLDLRASRALSLDEMTTVDAALGQDVVAPLFSGRASTPATRSVSYRGLPPSDGIGAGFYARQFVNTLGYAVAGTATRTVPITVMINQWSEIPPFVLGLIGSGKCRVVSDGTIPDLAADVSVVPLTDGLFVSVRSSDYTMEFAGETLAQRATPSPLPVSQSVEDLPSEPARVLAAVKIYNAVRYFSPYLSLMHDDWDVAFVAAVPEFRRASSRLAYWLAVDKFFAHLHDSHGAITSPSRPHEFEAGLPVDTRWLHGQAVITNFLDRAAAERAGAQVGDVILAVDSQPIERVIAYWKPYLNASTPQASYRRILGTAFTGIEGSRVRLTVRTPGGESRTLVFDRSSANRLKTRSGPIYRILPGNVAYVDFSRITGDQVDTVFAAIRNARAIVFDDRGYPQGAELQIARRLTAKTDVRISLFEFPSPRRMVTAADDLTFVPATESVYTMLPPLPGNATFLKPAVLLIDERAQSQAEYSGMMFRAADGMTFAGTPTAGADGNVTNFEIPGGMTLWLSGASVRWPDGRQTQRVGLLPDVRVEPSAADIGQGRDVVLLAALRVALRKSGASEAEANALAAREEALERSRFKLVPASP